MEAVQRHAALGVRFMSFISFIPIPQGRSAGPPQKTKGTRRPCSVLVFPSEHGAFVTAYLDSADQPFRKTVSSLAWGSHAWFASEPDSLIVFNGKSLGIMGS